MGGLELMDFRHGTMRAVARVVQVDLMTGMLVLVMVMMVSAL